MKNRCQTLAHIFILLLFAHGSNGQKERCLSNCTKPRGTQLTVSTVFLSQDEMCRENFKSSIKSIYSEVLFGMCPLQPCLCFSSSFVSLLSRPRCIPNPQTPPISSFASMLSSLTPSHCTNDFPKERHFSSTEIPLWVAKIFSSTHYPSKYL